MKVANEERHETPGTTSGPPCQKRDIAEHVTRRPVVEPETRRRNRPNHPSRPGGRRSLKKSANLPFPKNLRKSPSSVTIVEEAPAGGELHAPGAGTRLGQNRTLTNTRFPPASRERRSVPSDTVTPEKKPVSPSRTEEPDEEEIENEKPQPTKPTVEKSSQGQ